MKNYIKKSDWFTLIELIVAVTILSVIMLSVFIIYANIIQINKKLELNRILQENTRSMVEWLASEIRWKWIDYDFYDPAKWLDFSLDYVNWTRYLAIKGSWTYCMLRWWICDPACYTDTKWCYLGKFSTDIALSDDRVEVKWLKFFISWKPSSEATNMDKESKVTLVFDIWIASQKWLTSDQIRASSLHVQTTISEKIYKNMK
jgi:prepilin-type N-terminal cleavage/methylation domain-containing protein